MSWTVVARKDFEDAVRAKTLWVLVVLFALLIALSAWFFGEVANRAGDASTEELIISLALPTAFLLPAIGVTIGYKAIVGERDSGSIKLLLGLPHTRGDVLFGKFVGRSGIVSTAVVLGFLLGAVVFAFFAQSFAAVEYLLFLVMTIVLGIVFVGVAVGFSASTRSSTVAIVGGITLVLLFTLLWNIVAFLLQFVLGEYTGLADATVQDIAGFIASINPTTAYNRLLTTLFETQDVATGGFYTEPWFAVVVLAFWLIAPLALGYWRFLRAEL